MSLTQSELLRLPAKRIFLLHYHFFKNAGTSLDSLLQKAFPAQWDEREFVGSRIEMESQALKWISDSPETVCFSTHTYIGPPPRSENWLCIPLVFIRHPLDRIASVYEYERNQNAPGYGPEMAKRLKLEEFVRERNLIDSQVKNFHLNRLSTIAGVEPDTRSVAAFLDSLPFVGVVDQFEASTNRLAEILRIKKMNLLTAGTAFENVNRDVFASLDARLEALRVEVGDEFYQYLKNSNAEDLKLYELARSRLLA
jgi:hypothetical protein